MVIPFSNIMNISVDFVNMDKIGIARLKIFWRRFPKTPQKARGMGQSLPDA